MDRQEIAQAYAEFIRRETQAQKAVVHDFKALSGGAIQHNDALSIELQGGTFPGRHELVVRSDAPSGVSVSLSREEEFRILQTAYEAGVTVPRPLWLCTDPSWVGVDFYAMSRAAGGASPRAVVGEAIGEEVQRALTRQLGRELAKLHSIEPPHRNLDFLTQPDMSPAHDRLASYRRYLATIQEAHPVLEWGLNWLEENAPDSERLALCHCDFRTGNYMVENGELTAILDWEFAAWSDPYEDLGWLCSPSWRFGHNGKEVGGVGNKRDLFEGYREISGVRLEEHRVAYWQAMAVLRWGVIALQQAQRHLCGEQASLELALTGRMLPEIELDLLQQIKALEDVANA